MKIINETYTEKMLGHCYREYNFIITLEGIHDAVDVDTFADGYIKSHRRGQSNEYCGYEPTKDGNTRVYVKHLVDNSD